MTPWERRKTIENGNKADRVMCMPFMGELKCALTGCTVYEFWHDKEKMLEAEIAAYNRFGYDRIVIGPNTRGITEALGGRFVYPDGSVPYMEDCSITDYGILYANEGIKVNKERLQLFYELAELLMQKLGNEVPIETSIGGPFTIASNLVGVERLLRDCRRKPKEIHLLMRKVTNCQKLCINLAADKGVGIAMADPVANPALIGPKFYKEFVFPYTKEITEYAYERTGYKASLHMCGKTYGIWKFFKQYQLHEISLDNIVDMKRAAEELGECVPIAGNVDPMLIYEGRFDRVKSEIEKCIEIGRGAKAGFTLATGCDIPNDTDPKKVDEFMRLVMECSK